jgi:hypothetical protein
MRAAGFDRSFGDTWFEDAYHRNHWGVDDRAFFEQALGMVGELERGDQPWFLTLLSVGTHHPFNTPPDFEGSYEPGSAGWAMEYLDLAVGEFIRNLDDLGVLDETLVIITNDESRELVPGDNDIANSLRQAWGVLIVLHPSGISGRIHEPAMQLDVPISILDILGNVDDSSNLRGRSIFRDYKESRQLLWGNFYFGLVGGLSAEGQLAVCSENLTSCAAADLSTTLFSPDQKFSPIEASEVQWLIRGAEASLSTNAADRSRRVLLLASPGPIPVRPDVSEQFIFGGQFVTIPAGIRATVEIEARVTGKHGGVGFHHDLIVERRQAYLRTGRLNVGETLKISYSVAADFPLKDVESRFWINTIEGRDLELDFSVSRIRLEPVARGAADPGVVEHLFVIE